MAAHAPTPKLALVTLDIPCVSFVRFPTKTNIDPVEVVRSLCQDANSKDNTGPRSRYIKRLTPISLIRKTLSDGLESLCNTVLPEHFQTNPRDAEHPSNNDLNVQPCKFAIRPTIRNNNKINRDEIIQMVADKIAALGQGKHSVDLKGYDKLVLVDVYRNVVGMSVVGSDFEALKRFNLAEIHASRFEGEDDGYQKGGS
jgi:tRNA acetyltransferase TAN1